MIERIFKFFGYTKIKTPKFNPPMPDNITSVRESKIQKLQVKLDITGVPEQFRKFELEKCKEELMKHAGNFIVCGIEERVGGREVATLTLFVA